MIEQLVVIAIIAILRAILLPLFAQARELVEKDNTYWNGRKDPNP